MKTFLNVLYRRILYKIPLKRLLVGLAVFGVLFASFSSASIIYPLSHDGSATELGLYYITIGSSQTFSNDDGGLICYTCDEPNSICGNLDDGMDNVVIKGRNDNEAYCTSTTSQTITSYGNYHYYRIRYPKQLIKLFYPDYTSLQCQTEYNLIPISSVDQNYCISNNLCPSSGPSDCPNVGVSNLFINDIFHPGAFNIIMNIPEEIDWDYAYTNSGQNFNIDVVGYNVDYEKVQSVIDLQNYKPTDDDFSQIISVFAPYSKIIIFFVVLFSLWAMVKKPFKSKKL